MQKRSRTLGFFVIAAALATTLATGPAGATGELRLIQVNRSLTGIHEWYVQTYQGFPVLGSFYGRHLDLDGRVEAVDDGRLALSGRLAPRRLTAALAERVAGTGAVRSDLMVLPGRARLVWAVISADGNRALVDAATGAVVRRDREAVDVNGTGQVFDPNAVVTLQNQSLTDQNDANYTAIQSAYRTRTLTNLDGSGFLRGPFVDVTGINVQGQGDRAFSATNQFIYDRSNARFEEVEAYFSINAAQTYIQSLGFTNINNEPQDVSANTFADDNSFYSPGGDRITLGRGGVDDGEDADVIWHEYGHAIQDAQVPGFGITPDAGAIGEGFGDYWAVTMSIPVNGGYQLPCVADWDSTSYDPSAPHCLRRTDSNLTVLMRIFEVHWDGQIWSRALWDIHRNLGRTVADRIILEAQFSYSPATTFNQAASRTIATARLLYGNAAANVVRNAFRARLIIPLNV